MVNISKIKQLANDKGIRLTHITNKLGLKSPYFKDVELGKTKISNERLEIIADILGTTPEYLRDETENKEKPVKNADYINIENLLPIRVQRIPLIGTIAAGAPILATEEIECYVDAFTNIHVDFALKVRGTSMINARIYDGDIVFIRRQDDVNNGEIAAVLIEDEATLKRVFKQSNSVVLMAENPEFSPIIVPENSGMQIRILGKAIAFQSDVK